MSITAVSAKGEFYDFVEGDSPKYKFNFASGGEITTDKLSDTDKSLLATFLMRVGEEGRMPKAVS